MKRSIHFMTLRANGNTQQVFVLISIDQTTFIWLHGLLQLHKLNSSCAKSARNYELVAEEANYWNWNWNGGSRTFTDCFTVSVFLSLSHVFEIILCCSLSKKTPNSRKTQTSLSRPIVVEPLSMLCFAKTGLRVKKWISDFGVSDLHDRTSKV